MVDDGRTCIHFEATNELDPTREKVIAKREQRVQEVASLHEELQSDKRLERFGVGAEEERHSVLESGFLC